MTQDPREHAATLRRKAAIEAISARFGDGERDALAAADAWRDLGDRVGALDAVTVFIQAKLSQAKIGEALAKMEEVAGEAEALRDDPSAQGALAAFAEMYGRGMFRAGRYPEAVTWCDRALALAEPLRLDEVIAMALITKGTSLGYVGHGREGMALLNGAYLDATAHGLHVPALRAGVNLAALTSDTDPRISIQWTRDGMAVARRLGLSGFSTYHAGNTAAAQRLGDWGWIRSALADLAETVPNDREAHWIRNMAAVHLPWLGEDVGDRPLAMIAQAERAKDPQTTVNGHRWALDDAFAREDFTAAATHGRTLLEHDFAAANDLLWAGRTALQVNDMTSVERARERMTSSAGGSADADLATLRAGIAARQGRIDDAVSEYRAALTGYRDMGLRFDLAMAGLDMAAFLGADVPAVKAAAAEARAIFVDLGARPVIARLDRLVAPESPAVAEPGPAPVASGIAASTG